MISLRVPIVLLILLTAVACGGGDDNSRVPAPTLSATFTPTVNDPVGEALFMDAGSRSDATFTIRIMAANIDDLFGVGLRVIYDPAVVHFVGYDSSGSMLAGAGIQTFFQANEGFLGTLFVSATRIQDDPFVPGVDFTLPGELISLTFQADRTTAGSAFNFSNHSVEICDEAAETCSESLVPVWSGGTLTVN